MTRTRRIALTAAITGAFLTAYGFIGINAYAGKPATNQGQATAAEPKGEAKGFGDRGHGGRRGGNGNAGQGVGGQGER